jgi:uncharacterized protein (TIGR02145 family)
MKKVTWINSIIFAAILLFVACKKSDIKSDIDNKIPVPHYPVVKTLEVTFLDSTTATLNGTVNGYGLSTVVTFEYNTISSNKDGSPTLYSNSVAASQSPVSDSGMVNVSADISGLSPYRVYHFRIKAENSLWKNFYGSDQSFSKNGTVTDIDGNVYKTVQIGTQTWMAENLRTTHFNDGSPIELLRANWFWFDSTGTIHKYERTEWDAQPSYIKAYCWPDDNKSNAIPYGALYNWNAAMNVSPGSSSNPSDVQGVCPTGWHIPSEDEWTTLINFLGGVSFAGGKLKETDTIHWNSPNDGATNESGFTAVGSGRAGDGEFFNYTAYYWSSTVISFCSSCAPIGWDIPAIYLLANCGGINFEKHYSKEGHSVRCVKDPGHK